MAVKAIALDRTTLHAPPDMREYLISALPMRVLNYSSGSRLGLTAQNATPGFSVDKLHDMEEKL